MNLNEWQTLATSSVFKAVYSGSKPVFTITDTLGYTGFFDSLEVTPNLIHLFIDGEANGSILQSDKGINIELTKKSDLMWIGSIYTGVL